MIYIKLLKLKIFIPLIMFVIFPAIIALVATLAINFDLSGDKRLKNPICMPIDATFANPHNA